MGGIQKEGQRREGHFFSGYKPSNRLSVNFDNDPQKPRSKTKKCDATVTVVGYDAKKGGRRKVVRLLLLVALQCKS